MLEMDHLDEAVSRAQMNRVSLVFLSTEQANSEDLKSYSALNLNALLSELLLELPRKNRAREVAPLVEKLVNEVSEKVVLLHGIEILFDRCLAVDPVRLLCACAKNKTLLVSWPGDRTNSGLSYATPGHSEYRSYKASDLSDVIFLTADAQLH